MVYQLQFFNQWSFICHYFLFDFTLPCFPVQKMSLRKKLVQYINCFVAAFGTEHTNKQAKK